MDTLNATTAKTTTGGPDTPDTLEELEEHDVIDVRCGTSGDTYKVRLPRRARHNFIGWGDKPRVIFEVNGHDRVGVIIAQGPYGVTVVDSKDRVHRLKDGEYHVKETSKRRNLWKAGHRYLRMLKAMTLDAHGRLVRIEAMLKADGDDDGGDKDSGKRALQPGERWITVHPWGDDEKGVPVLITPNPDGTHSVIGGAGGKLNHLRLTKVGEPTEENKKKWAENAKRREDIHKDRTKEAEAEAEAEPKKAEIRRQQMEQIRGARKEVQDKVRELVEEVRDKLGGVSPDLDEEAMKAKGMSEGQINVAKAQHLRRQEAQARKVMGIMRRQLAEGETEANIAEGDLENAAERENATSEAREMARKDMEDEAADADERMKERNLAKSRPDSKDLMSKAAQEAFDAASDMDTGEAWNDAVQAGWTPLTDEDSDASAEADRERLTKLADAAMLADLVNHKPLSDEQMERLRFISEHDNWVVHPDEIDRLAAGEDNPKIKALAMREIGRLLRDAKKLHTRAAKFRKLEEEGKGAQAWNQLAFSRMQKTSARELRARRKSGTLDPGKRLPMTSAELDECVHLLQDNRELANARRRVRKIQRLVEEGKYNRSRREFDLNAEPAEDQDARQSVIEQTQTQLARQIRGFENPGSNGYIQSLAAGHYNGLADAALSISATRAVTREAMDAIGVQNAAILTRFAIEEAGHDPSKVLEALENHHISDQIERSSKALAAVAEMQPELFDKVQDVGDMELALDKMDLRDRDLAKVEGAIGSALGYMESMATLGQVFRGQPMPEALSVPLNGDVESTQRWLQAQGLRSEDYDLEMPRKGFPGRAIIPKGSWGYLLEHVSRASEEQRKEIRSIRDGNRDEEGWIPAGFPVKDVADAGPSRDVRIKPMPDVWRPSDDVSGSRRSLRNHVRSRLVEGENPWQIRSEMLHQDMLEGMSDKDRIAHIQLVQDVLPLTKVTVNGRVTTPAKAAEAVQKWKRAAARAEAAGKEIPDKPEIQTKAIPDQDLSGWAGAEAAKYLRGKEDGLHHQTVEAMHPEIMHAVDQVVKGRDIARVALKETEELSGDDMNALRDYFHEVHGGDDTSREYAIFTAALGQLGPEPPADTEHHRQWEQAKGKLQEQWPNFSVDNPDRWSSFVSAMGGEAAAYAALQQQARGEVMRDIHKRLPGRAGMVTGQAMLPHAETFVGHLGSADEQTRFTRERESMRQAIEGFMGEEGYQQDMSLAERIAKKPYEEQLATLAQVPAFAAEGRGTLPGHRFTLGSRMEQQLLYTAREIMRRAASGEKLPVPSPISMSGKRVVQQRGVKTAKALKRMALIAGTGTGKTAMSIGAATEALESGETEKALFLSPAAVTAQLSDEMHKFTQEGKYQWGASSDSDSHGHKSRMELLKDPSKQFAFMTYESFRSTAVRAVAEHQGISPTAAAEKIRSADTATVSKWIRDSFDSQGIPKPYIYADEIHKVNARAGAQESLLSKVVTAMAHPTNSTHMIAGTATPIRNDISELASMAVMVRPDKYPDRDSFMKAFGNNPRFNADALRRELGLFSYQASTKPSGIRRIDAKNPVVDENGVQQAGKPLPLSDVQQTKAEQVQVAFDTADRIMKNHSKRISRWRERNKIARQTGMEVDPKPKMPEGEVNELVDAMKVLSPTFDGDPAKVQRKAQARSLNKRSQMARIVHDAEFDHNPKLQAIAAKVMHDHKSQWTDKEGKVHQGKQSLIHCDRVAPLMHLKAHFESKGLRVGVIRGGVSDQKRNKVKTDFNEGKYDVCLVTRAGEAGLNLTRARTQHHVDYAQTAMSLEQREGRAYRPGAMGDVEIVQWSTDTAFDKRNQEILDDKAGLARELFGPKALALDESGLAGEYDSVVRAQGQGGRLRK